MTGTPVASPKKGDFALFNPFAAVSGPLSAVVKPDPQKSFPFV